jgi:hypothetical protein
MLRIPASKNRGFAMILMLLIMMTLTSISAVIIITATRDQQSSRLSSGQNEARLQATSALEDFYARIAVDSTLIPNILSTPPITDDYPAASATGAQLSALGFENFVSPTAPLGSQACATSLPEKFQTDCYSISIQDLSNSPLNPLILLVTATARVRCGGSQSKCIEVSLQQRIRRVQFYDYLLAQQYNAVGLGRAILQEGSNDYISNAASIANYEDNCSKKVSADRPASFSDVNITIGTDTIPISNCLEISYQADAITGDNLDGPVYTADDYLLVCGNPTFTDVQVAGSGYSGGGLQDSWYKPSLNGCSVNPPQTDTSTVNASLLLLPDSAPTESCPTTDCVLEEQIASATAGAISRYDITGPATMLFNADGTVDITSNDSVSPVSALDTTDKLFVVVGDGDSATRDLQISGTVTGSVSVVVKGDPNIPGDLGTTAIVGDLQYANPVVDALSLTSTGPIEIWQECSTGTAPGCGGAYEDRTVEGILVSTEGFIGVTDWFTNFPSTSPRPTLHFTGSMTSRYQGVFGAYNRDTGSLLSGFYKDFVFDNRFTNYATYVVANPQFSIPPFTVSSTVTVWKRLDLTQVGVAS